MAELIAIALTSFAEAAGILLAFGLAILALKAIAFWWGD